MTDAEKKECLDLVKVFGDHFNDKVKRDPNVYCDNPVSRRCMRLISLIDMHVQLGLDVPLFIERDYRVYCERK
jgi:hypothetical protein